MVKMRLRVYCLVLGLVKKLITKTCPSLVVGELYEHATTDLQSTMYSNIPMSLSSASYYIL